MDQSKIQSILNIQRQAWSKGHDNYGAEIDIWASAIHFLQSFKHLNPAQKNLLTKVEAMDETKYAKRLCSKANKSIRHFIVTLK